MTDLNEIKKILQEHTKILKNIEKTIQSTGQPGKIKEDRKRKNRSSKVSSGLKGSILELKKESFFKTPKELKEIRASLEAKAAFYPRTSYPRQLLDLIKEKELRRLKEKNKWKYVNNG